MQKANRQQHNNHMSLHINVFALKEDTGQVIHFRHDNTFRLQKVNRTPKYSSCKYAWSESSL